MLNNEDIKSLNDNFPHRNEDGTAAFWPHQKKVLLEALEEFRKGQRVVVIDAPVGSGKSAINYTLLKSLGDEKAVYLTAQKSLQDQIESDDLPGLKIIKGRNAYTCPRWAAAGYEKGCDSPGFEKVKTCHETKKFEYPAAQRYDALCNSIKKSTSLPRVERIKVSGFSNPDEIRQVREWLAAQDPALANEGAFVRAVACNILPVECPVKSVRLFAKCARVIVANPDVFYNLNQFTGVFDTRKYMVVDEAHRLEDAIQRIFRIKIPVHLIKEIFGIDFSPLLDIKSPDKFYEEALRLISTQVLPMMAACDVMDQISDIFYIHDIESAKETGVSQMTMAGIDSFKHKKFGALLPELQKGIRDYNAGSFCLFNVANTAFQGLPIDALAKINPAYMAFKELHAIIQLMYETSCDSYGCAPKYDFDDRVMPAVERFLRRKRHTIHTISSMGARHIKSSEKGYGYSIGGAVSFLLDHYESFSKICSVIGVASQKRMGRHAFVINVIEMPPDRACIESDFSDFIKDIELVAKQDKVIELVPLDIGVLLQDLFFKKDIVEKIILSSGTWPDYEGTLKMYGFNVNGVKKIKLGSIFDPDHRTIYVCSDPTWTDFGEKCSGGYGYLYETDEGKTKFCGELFDLILYIRNKHGAKCNIAVHTFSFKIAQMIAENARGVGDDFLVHLPRIKDPVINKYNGYSFERLSKEQLVSKFKNNPDAGLTLVSPSIGEGLDFKYGICRAQIIVKAPIPYLGDIYTKSKFHGIPELGFPADRMFLDRKCAIDLNQTYGRNVRAPDDWGETYIMDLSITKRLAKAFGVTTPGIPADSPGNMGKLDLDYIAEGISIVKDKYDRPMFYWPLGNKTVPF